MSKETTKAAVMNALLELSKTKPIDKITVEDLLKKSFISKSTFYNHFRDKYDVIFWIYRTKADRLFEKLGDNYDWYDLLKENLLFYKEHSDFLFNALENTHGQDSYIVQAATYAAERITQYICDREQIDAVSEDLDFSIRMYVAGSIQMYPYWLKHCKEMAIPHAASLLVDGMPEGLRKYLLNT